MKYMFKHIPFCIWVLLPLVLCVMLFCNFRIIITDGSSMEPTYKGGDILLVRRTDQVPDIGDEILIKLSDGTCVLKRVAYLSGSDVTQDGYEAYWADADEAETAIPDGHVYVLGDNLEDSVDSRSKYFGLVSLENIWGTPVFKFPFSISVKEE